jgi:hypothetical protein
MGSRISMPTDGAPFEGTADGQFARWNHLTREWEAATVSPGAIAPLTLTFYVDQDYAGGGSDGSIAAPFVTIQDAVDAIGVENGVILIVGTGGLYDEVVAQAGNSIAYVSLSGQATVEPRVHITEIEGSSVSMAIVGCYVETLTGIGYFAVEAWNAILPTADGTALGVNGGVILHSCQGPTSMQGLNMTIWAEDSDIGVTTGDSMTTFHCQHLGDISIASNAEIAQASFPVEVDISVAAELTIDCQSLRRLLSNSGTRSAATTVLLDNPSELDFYGTSSGANYMQVGAMGPPVASGFEAQAGCPRSGFVIGYMFSNGNGPVGANRSSAVEKNGAALFSATLPSGQQHILDYSLALGVTAGDLIRAGADPIGEMVYYTLRIFVV